MIGVMPLEGLFGDRDRATSFGSVAERYDRYRSGYPDELVDDLLAMGPRTALDVGCGTGKLARVLMARGVEVLGVDPDARMAAIAQRHGVPVEVAPFEDWDDRGRTFDLITSGHAWHWIDPRVGPRRVAELLRPGTALPAFVQAERRTYRWTRELPAEDWVGLISTFGDHVRLPADRFTDLAEQLVRAIHDVGGTVRVSGGSYLLLARRAA